MALNHVKNIHKITDQLQHQAVIPPPPQQFAFYKHALCQSFKSSVMAKLDSGASKSYFKPEDTVFDVVLAPRNVQATESFYLLGGPGPRNFFP